ncbi:helix-turn-helix transcriptional regulator [Hyphomicrobium sp.]|uniref:helix-turn-helix domain-containing protein n=1 Tax=Hyphomicrobium sp. TaxID=82 RepID=UPI0025B80983|nr:helix-turn-helix transcriptional regulator [Hyphomicrobium sp.]MCC7253048.1 helix-turn-helix transcriptional regulator [Hyphomicrobium sp.]
MTSIDALVGWRIRARRTELGMSPETLADIIGLETDQVLACEAGRRRAGAEDLIRLCAALDVGISYFYD